MTQPPELSPVATRDSWKTVPPGAMVRLACPGRYTADEVAVMRRGLVPQEMEDKWFIFWENDWLSFHRSWTGLCIYRLRLRQAADQTEVAEAWVCDDPAVYRRGSDRYESAMVDFLIRGLLLGQDVDFPLPPGLASGIGGIFQHHIAGTAFPERSLAAAADPRAMPPLPARRPEVADQWRCPFCGRNATRSRASICDSRACDCGAVIIGAPACDQDEVTDDAIALFHVTRRPESSGTLAGVDIRPGVRVPDPGGDDTDVMVYTWFRRQRG